MYAVVRRYSDQGAKGLFDTLEQRTADVEQVMRGVPGFVAYSLIRTGEGGLSLTICQDKTGTDESIRRAAEWVRANVPTTVAPPEVSEGNVLLQIS